MWVHRLKALGFPKPLAMNWMGNGAPGKGTGTRMRYRCMHAKDWLVEPSHWLQEAHFLYTNASHMKCNVLIQAEYFFQKVPL